MFFASIPLLELGKPARRAYRSAKGRIHLGFTERTGWVSLHVCLRKTRSTGCITDVLAKSLYEDPDDALETTF